MSEEERGYDGGCAYGLREFEGYSVAQLRHALVSCEVWAEKGQFVGHARSFWRGAGAAAKLLIAAKES